MSSIKYVHTNILASDWKKLSRFYIDVFDCEPIFPERDLHGKWMEDMTGISGVHVRGIHLKLPGYEQGPTLEIFSYNKVEERKAPNKINDVGFTHIAFRVDDVEKIAKKVIANGGRFYGKIIETEINDVGTLTAAYMRDPEGNIIEIQHWR
jgi:predicted enzyme related to lactoylglutathione lyase